MKFNKEKIEKCILLLSFVNAMKPEKLQKSLDERKDFKSAFENALAYIDGLSIDETRVVSEVILNECIEVFK